MKRLLLVLTIMTVIGLCGCGNVGSNNTNENEGKDIYSVGDSTINGSGNTGDDKTNIGTIKEFYTAEDFVCGNEELSDVDESGNYVELYYKDGTAYALLERENSSTSVCLEVIYLFHEPNTEGYYLMTTEVTSSGEGSARAYFNQDDGCIFKVKAVYTSVVEGKETVITKELGELR